VPRPSAAGPRARRRPPRRRCSAASRAGVPQPGGRGTARARGQGSSPWPASCRPGRRRRRAGNQPKRSWRGGRFGPTSPVRAATPRSKCGVRCGARVRLKLVRERRWSPRDESTPGTPGRAVSVRFHCRAPPRTHARGRRNKKRRAICKQGTWAAGSGAAPKLAGAIVCSTCDAASRLPSLDARHMAPRLGPRAREPARKSKKARRRRAIKRPGPWDVARRRPSKVQRQRQGPAQCAAYACSGTEVEVTARGCTAEVSRRLGHAHLCITDGSSTRKTWCRSTTSCNIRDKPCTP
jgi:hypothetical protein